MNIERLFFPLTVFAAVVGVYVFFRSQNTAVQAVTPNTASSGVPASYTASGVVQPATFDVPALTMFPNANTVLKQPTNPNPNGPSLTADGLPPAYLTFNLGPRSDLNKAAQPVNTDSPGAGGGGCGCGGCKEKQSCRNQCNQSNAFPDGGGNSKLASSGRRLVALSNPDSWLPNSRNNAESYIYSTGVNPLQSLTNFSESGSLH